MQAKLLNEIVSDIVGKSGSEILKLLMGKKDVNEFLIAKKLKLTINQVRNILYKLSNYSLVSFTRKKDRKKGWYTYFWTLDNGRALELLDKKMKKEILMLEQQLKSREIKRFYICGVCKTETSEETALLHSFTCPECGQVYELANNKKVINELNNSIARLERQRKEVLSELDKIREVKEKKIMREVRKEEKAKKRKAKKIRGKVEKARRKKPVKKKKVKKRKLKKGKSKKRVKRKKKSKRKIKKKK